MGIVIEDGSGLLSANSYASENTFTTYCEDRAYTIAIGDVEAALIRATQFIDSYRARFPGYRAKRRLQALEWPRVGAYTSVPSDGREYPYPLSTHRSDSYQAFLGYSFIANNEIPIEIIHATCEAALRELAVPGSMAPDLERGGMVRSLKAGSVAIEYQPNANPNSTTQLIDGILSGLLMSASGGWFAASGRG